jgi:multidrug efflux system outer membrane protein
VPFYKRQIAITETALAVLLGRNPYEIIAEVTLEDQEFPADIPPGIPSTILERRPDIMAAESRYHAETANVGVAEAQRFPAISLTGLIGGLATQELGSAASGGMAWSASAGLLSPLLNWGKNKKRAEIQKQVALQSAYAYENTIIQAFKEVEDALIYISTYKFELQARDEQVTAAVSARDLSKQRYDGGVTSYLEVIENDRAAFEAELQYSQARQQLLNGYILLYKALGGGWLSAEQEQAAAEANDAAAAEEAAQNQN